MAVDTKWFMDQLAGRGFSQRSLAHKLGLDQSAISLTFRGRRAMKFNEAADIARLLGLPVSDVLRHAGVPVDEGKQTIPVGAWMDGHGELHCLGMDGERIITPCPMPAGSSAVQCRTAGSPLEYMDGWMLFIEPPAAPTIGQYSVVQIRSGIRTPGTIRRGYKKGRFNLTGPAIDMTDVDLEWAAPVVNILT